MHERTELALKVACAVLAAMLFYQVVRMFAHGSPLGGVNIPALPTLTAPTNAPEKPSLPVAAQVLTKSATNTDNTSGPKGTNATKSLAAVKVDTNASAQGKTEPRSTIHTSATNRAAAGTNDSRSTNAALTSEIAKGTNSGSDVRKAGTNLVAGESGKTGVVARAENSPGKPGPGSARVGPGSGKVAGRAGAKKAAELTPAMQARVDKITDSEILGPVIHPLPMALLGIAGNVAFLRSPNGQAEMVKVGDEMGGLKLLQIGTNRVLVLHDGEKKELTIFSGMGGDSLMPKDGKGTTK